MGLKLEKMEAGSECGSPSAAQTQDFLGESSILLSSRCFSHSAVGDWLLTQHPRVKWQLELGGKPSASQCQPRCGHAPLPLGISAKPPFYPGNAHIQPSPPFPTYLRLILRRGFPSCLRQAEGWDPIPLSLGLISGRNVPPHILRGVWGWDSPTVGGHCARHCGYTDGRELQPLPMRSL